MNAVIPRLLCGLVGLFASQALAQSSTIIGTVIDVRSRQPVSEVAITLTSPNLEGKRTAVSDGQGNYRIPLLPPGVYLLRFEKEEYKPYERSDVQLRLTRTIRVNVELIPESLDEEVETAPCVGCCMPAGVNVDAEFIKRIAIPYPGRKEETVTQEPSPPQYNFSPAMPGMSMTLRLHPVPSDEAPRSPRRDEPPTRAHPSAGSAAPVPESSPGAIPVDPEFIRRIAVASGRIRQKRGTQFIGVTPEAMPCPPVSANVPNLHYGMTRDGMVLTRHTRWMGLEPRRHGGSTYESVARCF